MMNNVEDVLYGLLSTLKQMNMKYVYWMLCSNEISFARIEPNRKKDEKRVIVMQEILCNRAQ